MIAKSRNKIRRLLGGAAAGLVLAAGIYFARPPVSQDILNNTSIVVTDRNGAWLSAFAEKEGRWRFEVNLAGIDPKFIKALIEIEDRRYYHHVGVDVPAIGRALGSWIKAGEVVSGASTITMQLVRQYKPRPRTLKSKAIESIEALRFELHYSKAEILEQYLTRISYGGNIEGLEAASRIYLGKSPRYLSSDEIALLIALPQAPEARRPDRQAAHAKRGRDRILKKMQIAELLDADSYKEATTAPIPLLRHDLPQKAWLSSYYMEKSGPITHSYIDPQLQDTLEQQLGRYVAQYPKTVNASAVLVHNDTREIRAHAAIGHRGHDGGWIDMTRRLRSPGSTLKPFVYGLGADDGVLSFDSLVRDAPSRFGLYQPENFNRRYYGDVRISDALQHSLNIPAVAVLDHVGGRRLQAALMAGGIDLPTSRSESPDAGLAIALGGTGTTALDLATLYTALANDGLAQSLRWHDQQEDSSPYQLLSAQTSQDLRRVMANSPVPSGHLPGQILKDRIAIAYKTGTSYGFRDSWAAGITGDYTIVIWVGRPDGAPRPGVTGRKAAAPLLFDIARAADLVGDADLGLDSDGHGSIARVQTPTDEGPQIIFPSPNTEIAYTVFGKDGRGVTLMAQSETGDVRLYVNGAAVDRRREGHIWHPQSPGFYKLTAVDNQGRSESSRFRVLSVNDLLDAPF